MQARSHLPHDATPNDKALLQQLADKEEEITGLQGQIAVLEVWFHLCSTCLASPAVFIDETFHCKFVPRRCSSEQKPK